MIAPCKDCPDRYLNCHDQCEKYKEYKEELDRVREIRNKEYEKNSCSYESVMRAKQQGHADIKALYGYSRKRRKK